MVFDQWYRRWITNADSRLDDHYVYAFKMANGAWNFQQDKIDKLEKALLTIQDSSHDSWTRNYIEKVLVETI